MMEKLKMTRPRESSFTPEDPLTYLPRKPVQEFARKRVIYDPQQPSDHLFVVILGRVKISNISDDGGQLVARIVASEGIFGESSLIGAQRRHEAAVALDNVTLMSWSAAEIETQIEREPRLGLALSQYLVRECIELQDRIESMAVYKTPERVMLALIQLADSLGSPMADSSIRVPALTHHTIAEFVGTSREIVTFQLNRLRRLGMLRYSRKHMDVYTGAIQGVLRNQGVDLPHLQSAMRAGG
jgi:CRP/FNR family transcriptional regulator, cyclic AMP receptor protein